MMRIGILSILMFMFMLFGLSPVAAQDSGKAFYSEFGGQGVLLSVSFDSRFQSDTRTGFGYRVGLGFGVVNEDYYEYYPGGNRYYNNGGTKSYATIPFGINYLLGKKNSPHMLEVGVGATILTRKVNLYNYGNEYATEGNVIGYINFMYRRQPPGGGFMWKIGLTPIIGTAGDIVPSASIGLGYAF